ncbi:hypothetical protein [Nakamurella sp.]|uniref:hypothetical protein n=1 Tax=Nakamurella sp. TaxID=1869182 RepID=UPI003B3A4E0F
MKDDEIGKWFEAVFNSAGDASAARDLAHTQLRNAGLLPKVTLHRYMCKAKNCQIATVFQVGGRVLCAVRDYTFSPGLNAQVSVPAARKSKTLDGERHWPGQVYDVSELEEWGPQAGMSFECRHFHGTVIAADALRAVEGVEPGRPRRPTFLPAIPPY